MKKIMILTATALTGLSLLAEEAQPEMEKQEGRWNNWRLTIGGFGRGNMKTTMKGLGDDRVTAYGADLDFQYNVWQNRNFNLWAGIGGTFCPRQKASDGFGSSRSTNSHTTSDDGYVTTDVNTYDSYRGDVDLGYGEFRMMFVPEWKVTDSLAVGARVGVAFGWINVKASGCNEWNWNSRIATYIPPYVDDVTTDGDSGRTDWSDSQTEFAAQAILGLQATYMFTDWVGLYANFDWRLGGETDFQMADNQEVSVDMSGWYWGVGAVVSF